MVSYILRRCYRRCSIWFYRDCSGLRTNCKSIVLYFSRTVSAHVDPWWNHFAEEINTVALKKLAHFL